MESKSLFCAHCSDPSGSSLCIHRACIFFLFSFISGFFLFPSSRVQIIPSKFRFCLSLVLQFPCLFQSATVCGNHFGPSPSAPCGVISSPLLFSTTKRGFVLCNYRLKALLTDAGMSLYSERAAPPGRPPVVHRYTRTHVEETQFSLGWYCSCLPQTRRFLSKRSFRVWHCVVCRSSAVFRRVYCFHLQDRIVSPTRRSKQQAEYIYSASLFACRTYFSTMKMQAVRSSETSVNF